MHGASAVHLSFKKNYRLSFSSLTSLSLALSPSLLYSFTSSSLTFSPETSAGQEVVESPLLINSPIDAQFMPLLKPFSLHFQLHVGDYKQKCSICSPIQQNNFSSLPGSLPWRWPHVTVAMETQVLIPGAEGGCGKSCKELHTDTHSCRHESSYNTIC